MITENGFWKYGSLWRNGGDRDFVRYAATESSPAKKVCDLYGEISNNNSPKIANNKEKNLQNQKPEFYMDKSLG